MASSSSLCLSTHLHALPVVALSVQEDFGLVYAGCKLREERGADITLTAGTSKGLTLPVGEKRPRDKESKQHAAAGLEATGHTGRGDQLTAACLLKISQ